MSSKKSENKTIDVPYFYLGNPVGMELYGKTRFEETEAGDQQIQKFIKRSPVKLCSLRETEKGSVWDLDPKKEGFFIWMDALEDPVE